MGFLKEVKHFLGNTTLIESDPAEEIVSSAVFLPFSRKSYFDIDPEWGIYHRNGQLVAAAAYRRGPDMILVGQSQTRDLNNMDFDYIDEELIYGGPVIMHYGHFITATLPRLWNIINGGRRGRRIAFHHDTAPGHWWPASYTGEILGALGLTPDDLVHIERPSIIKRLWVPRPALEEQNFVHRTFADLGVLVGRAFGLQDIPQGDHAVYVSKTRLKRGVTAYEDEYVLESLLAARGVAIMHPQELSFPEQLRQLAAARVIGGTAGSAFHSSLFLDRPSRIVALNGWGVINANFALIDKAKGNDTVYLYPSEPAQEIPSIDGFNIKWVMNMTAVAEDYAARLLQ